MSLPPFFSTAVLLFWGWQTGLIGLALPLAMILEGSRYVKTNWDLSQADFNRITDICTILLAGLAVFLLTTDSTKAIMGILKWLPLICFPLVAAQEYSVVGRIDIRALMLLARNKAVAADNRPRTIDVSPPYAALCIVAAGSGNVKDGSFFIGLVLLAAWALWPQRSQRFSPLLWFLLLVLICGAGYVGQIGLYRLHMTALRMTSHWWFSRNSDPFSRSTSLGDVGEMKLSDRIVFRITPEKTPFQPVLIREGAYNLYRGTSWHASPSQLTNLSPESDKTTWKLGEEPKTETGAAFTVWTPLKKGKGMLPLPIGAYRLENLLVDILQQTPLGAVKVEEGPGLIGYRVLYHPTTSRILPPSETDLLIPPRELPAVEQIVEELHLHSRPPEEVVRVLADFFQNQFAYSLKLRANEKGKTSLATFLLSSRTGHCEYFATATVLILRACGIPARYATGWSAHEFSRLEQEIIVRSRHAHAWTLVYLNGTWHNLDTTLASWIDSEDEAASDLTVLQDLWSFVLFRFSRWRWGAGQGTLDRWWWLLLIPLLIILVRRLSAGRKIRRVRTGDEEKNGADASSERTFLFYRIEKRLNELGFERNLWEPPLSWIHRMKATSSADIISDRLLACLGLHYQERFSRRKLTAAQQKQLQKQVESVLGELAGKQQAKES